MNESIYQCFQLSAKNTKKNYYIFYTFQSTSPRSLSHPLFQNFFNNTTCMFHILIQTLCFQLSHWYKNVQKLIVVEVEEIFFKLLYFSSFSKQGEQIIIHEYYMSSIMDGMKEFILKWNTLYIFYDYWQFIRAYHKAFRNFKKNLHYTLCRIQISNYLRSFGVGPWRPRPEGKIIFRSGFFIFFKYAIKIKKNNVSSHTALPELSF